MHKAAKSGIFLGLLLLLVIAAAVGYHLRITSEVTVDQSALIEHIRKAVAIQRHISANEIDVELLADAAVPGLTVFTATQQANHNRRGTYDTGIASATLVETNTQKAIELVLHAWGYGVRRTVPPKQVAKVIGFIEGAFHNPTSTNPL